MKGQYSYDTCANRAKSKTRLASIDDLDGRTHAARKAAQLVSGLESDLGGTEAITVGQRELVKRAALLGAITEDAEVRWLRKEKVDLNVYLAAINVQRRVLTTLGLDRRAREVGSALSDQHKLDRILGYVEEAAP